MDFLTDIPRKITPAVERSPFWAKAYGGYTKVNLEFFENNIGSVHGKRICDPMSGQALSLCQMSWRGARVSLCDILPGPLALASLRDPLLLRQSDRLTAEIERRLRRLRRYRNKSVKRQHCQEWISPEVAEELREIAWVFDIHRDPSPFQKGTRFWEHPPLTRLVLGLVVLAARSITCFQTSDNTTWLKKGGITPAISTVRALEDALFSWKAFAEDARSVIHGSGGVRINTWNCEEGIMPRSRNSMDAVVVSPPYANRLDYSLMWGCELAVAAGIFGAELFSLKGAQMGTTVVKRKWPDDDDVRALPKEVFAAICQIRTDKMKASEQYYYPFFANYAISLARSVESWCTMIRRRGKLLVVVRDTVRGDHLFPTDVIVRQTAKRAGLRQINSDESPYIIRSHVGLLRHRRAKAGVHGLAQREWMLAFVKD